MDYSKLIDLGSKVSLAFVLMVILYGGVTGWWVAGTTYKEMIADRDAWKELAIKGVKVASQAARPIVTGPNNPFVKSLPSNPTREEVNQRLNQLHKQTAYITEPTDKP